MSSAAQSAPVLGSKQSGEVLRYWAALLRYEEALAARPRARQSSGDGSEQRAPNVAEPVAGQDYMKLPFAGAEPFLVSRTGSVELELSGERVAFFEDWLSMRYRPGEDSEERAPHLVLYPVVHLPRAELAGVLRFPAEVTWRTGDKAFTPPTAAERGQRALPAPPTHLRLAQPGKDPDQTLPFFVDTRLLRETLHVGAEDLDAFFAELRGGGEVTARDMVVRVCKLLEAGGRAPALGEAAESEREATAADLLGRLSAAVHERLARAGSRSRVYSVALVVNGERARATWHVQRDLSVAMAQIADGELPAAAPLAVYLRGDAAPGNSEVCLGRWPRAPLTASQRGALELALGSSFMAVQGPPGSGKTSLILNAAVHQLIQKVRVLADQGAMGEDFLLVTSTNNRAVDNVVEPLCSDDVADPPLALRLGSREVTEQVTPRTLERTLRWLERQPKTAPEGELDRARQAFSSLLSKVESLTKARRSAYAARSELRRLQSDAAPAEANLEAPGEPRPGAAPRRDPVAEADARVRSCLEVLAAAPTASDVGAPPWRSAPGKAQAELGQLVRALEQLSRECEKDTAARRLPVSFERIVRRALPKAGAALGVELGLGLPPAQPAPRGDETGSPEIDSSELWEEAIERALARLQDLSEALAALAAAPAQAVDRSRREGRIVELRAELERAPALEADDSPELSELYAELYRAALELRRAWLRHHRAAIEKNLQLAMTHCRRMRSLRSLLESPRGAGAWLRQLYPCFGCTLLSLGNAFAGDSTVSARVIIDEAGQCHSAYAVSALLRARSALVLGDVNQLEPVVGLSLDDERRIRRGLGLALRDAELEPFRMYDECGNSAQSLADRAVPGRPTLRDHFRCQPEIIALCEAWCGYGMAVRTPRRSRADVAPELGSSVLFAPASGEQQPFAGSWVNSAEVEELVLWVQRLLARGVPAADLGVIAPFRAQAEALLRALRAARVPIELQREDVNEETLSLFAAPRGGLALGTVHRFQGGERSIMLFSTTVTRPQSLRFLDQRVNLLNVAASRARDHLIVIGHEATLRAGKHTAVLIERAARA